MYRQRRAVERIVTLEVMRLERRRTIERDDIAHARRRSAVAAPTATVCAVFLRARAHVELVGRARDGDWILSDVHTSHHRTHRDPRR
jgi:hypothetical protein